MLNRALCNDPRSQCCRELRCAGITWIYIHQAYVSLIKSGTPAWTYSLLRGIYMLKWL